MSRRKGSKNWKIEEIEKAASFFSKRKDFMEQNESAYRAAKVRGILDKICSNMEPNTYNIPWTEEGLKKEALKYKTRNGFKKNQEGAYATARKLGILDKICSHMKKPQKPYTEDEIGEEAKKFTTRRKFKLGSKMYSAATRRGKDFMDEICSHMKKSKGTSIEEEKIMLIVKEHFTEACRKRFKNKDTDNFRQTYYELDIFIPELKKGIEFDGDYWHDPKVMAKNKKITLEEASKYHEQKDSFFKNLGIDVLHIKEGTWNVQQLWQKRRVLSFIGVLPMPPAHKFFRFHWAQNPDSDGEF